jgi:hypothetical protein
MVGMTFMLLVSGVESLKEESVGLRSGNAAADCGVSSEGVPREVWEESLRTATNLSVASLAAGLTGVVMVSSGLTRRVGDGGRGIRVGERRPRPRDRVVGATRWFLASCAARSGGDDVLLSAEEPGMIGVSRAGAGSPVVSRTTPDGAGASEAEVT